MLWADVDNKILRRENHSVLLLDLAVRAFHVCAGSILHRFVVQTHGVDFRICVVVLAERKSHPVVTQEETAHIRMVYKFNTVEVIYFAFIDTGHCIQVGQ